MKNSILIVLLLVLSSFAINSDSKKEVLYKTEKGNLTLEKDFFEVNFDIDYYNEPSSKSFRDKAPILEVIGEYGEHLDEMFQGHWHEPMKKWFENNFNLPVKSVSTYYDYEDYN